MNNIFPQHVINLCHSLLLNVGVGMAPGVIGLKRGLNHFDGEIAAALLLFLSSGEGQSWGWVSAFLLYWCGFPGASG